MKNQKVEVGVAAKRNSVKPLKFKHLTTAGFNQLQPLMYRPCIATEKLKGKASFFVRSDAMVNPVMTGVRFLTHNFYVRYKDVWPAWDDFDNQTMHSYPNAGLLTNTPAIPKSVPFIKMGNLIRLLMNTDLGFVIAQDASADENNSDIKIQVSNNTAEPEYKFYRFSNAGFRAYKLLNSLGYVPLWDVTSEEPVELLTLMCYFKVFTDWYLKAGYSVSDTSYRIITSAFNTDPKSVEATSSSSLNNYYLMLMTGLEKCCQTFYSDDDYYEAWDNPMGPNSNAIPSLQIPDIANEYPFNPSSGNTTNVLGQSVVNDINSNGTPTISASYNTPTDPTVKSTAFAYRINQYMVDSLKRMSDMVRRFALVGVRSVDRFLVRYGIQLQDTHRALLLGSKEHYLMVGDVESNADSSNGTTTSNLGDLAGKGVTLSDIDISCNAGSHAGTFFVLLSTIGEQSLAFGSDPFHFNTLYGDFYTPENDSLGTSVVPQCAVRAHWQTTNRENFFKRFAFMKQYYEYLVNRNIVSGAFVCNTFGAQYLNSWHTFRILPDDGDLVHSLAFLKPNTSDNLLENRIFYSILDEDKFKVYFKAGFTSSSVMTPLKHVYDFEDDSRTIDVVENGVNVN